MFVSFYCLELWITLALCCHLVHSEEYIYISVLDSCGSDFIAAACVYGNYQAWKLLWGFCLGHWFFRTCAGLSGVMLLEAAKLPVWLGSWWFGMFYFYGLSKQSKRKSWTYVEYVWMYWSCSMFLLARSKEGPSQNQTAPAGIALWVLLQLRSNISAQSYCTVPSNLSDFLQSPRGKSRRLNVYRTESDFSFRSW